MIQHARTFVVMLETSWGETVDVFLATDDMSLGDLEARGMAAWAAMHDDTYPVKSWSCNWRIETLVDWSPA